MKKFLIMLKNHRFALIVSVLVLLGCGYWCFWHFKPFTPNAFVFAYTRPVSPFTEGFITHIHVKNNQFVKKGDNFLPFLKSPINLKSPSLKMK